MVVRWGRGGGIRINIGASSIFSKIEPQDLDKLPNFCVSMKLS